jgi:PAS domain S-box-containing protein
MSAMEERTDLGYQQALRYAEELRELYESERARRAELESAQGQLREAEARYRSLVERLPAIVYQADFGESGEWTYVSPQIESILGFTPEEWMADPKLWYKQIHPEDRPRALEEENHARFTGEPLLSEYRLLTRDGRVAWFRDEAVVVPGGSGQLRSLQGLMYDITDEKRSEEALQLYTQRLESLRQIDLAILAAGSIEELIQAALSRLRNLVSCERATVSLIDFEAESLEVFATDSTGEMVFGPGTRLPLDTLGALGEELLPKLRGGEVTTLNDITALPDLPPALRPSMDAGIRSILSAPLLSQEELIGLLTLSARHPAAFGAEHTEVAVEVANQLAIAIHQSRLREALTEELGERRRAEEKLRKTLDDLRSTDEARQRLLSHLTMAQEEERSRIAGDIHDDTIQVMTAVGMRLDILRRELQLPDQIDLLEHLEETVRKATGRLRNLLFELHPPTLDRDGLAAALRVYLQQNLEQTGLAYTLEDRLTGEPPAETRVILYRIAQEALANVRKHARASSVAATMESSDGGFLVRIADDGVGFLQEDAHDRLGHLGLASIRERAEMAGGWIRIDSAPGAGTTVEFWLPEMTASTVGEG